MPFKKELPADAVALRQRQRVRVADGEHAPQPRLEKRGVEFEVEVVAQHRARAGEQRFEVGAGNVGARVTVVDGGMGCAATSDSLAAGLGAAFLPAYAQTPALALALAPAPPPAPAGAGAGAG